MKNSLTLEFQQILKVFPNQTFVKGKDYYLSGAVEQIAVSQEKDQIQLQATVTGRRNSLYYLQVIIDQTFKTLTSTCSCPLTGDCKHVVAALFEACTLYNKEMMEHPLDRQKSSSFRSPAWESWLNTLPNETPLSTSPTPSAHRWIYIFEHELTKIHTLQVKLSKTLKTGGFGAPKNMGRFSSVTNRAAIDVDWTLKGLLEAAAVESQIPQRELSAPNYSQMVLSHFHHIDMLIHTGRCFIDNRAMTPLEMGPTRNLTFAWHQDSAYHYNLHPQVEGIDTPLILNAHSLWYIDPQTCHIGALNSDLPRSILTKLLDAPKVPIEATERVSQQLIQQCPQAPTYLLPPSYPEITRDILPQPQLKLFGAPIPQRYFHDNSDIGPFAQIAFNYAGVEVTLNNPEMIIYQIIDQTRWKIPRQLTAEKSFIERLLQTPLKPITSIYKGYISTERQYHFGFLTTYSDKTLEAIRQLAQEGWKIQVDPSFPLPWTEVIEDWYLKVDAQPDDENWFNVQLGVQVNGETIDLLPLIKKCLDPQTLSLNQLEELEKIQSYKIEIKPGQYIAIPGSRLQQILTILLEMHDSTHHKDSLHRTKSLALLEWEQHFSEKPLVWKGSTNLKQLAQQLQSYSPTLTIDPPKGLQAQLRPYQLAGLSWLQFLRTHQFGGILADDMGLGKTIQTLAHLLLEKESGRMKGPSLIIAPTSLMGNWQAEAARFTPTLKVITIQGLLRKPLFEAIQDADLVLTTYPLLARDQESLLKHNYYYLILDEAQIIKNSQTKSTQIAFAFQAQYRLCLTGTPMENHLGELWTLFHFLAPGLLGNKKHFTQFFRTPIEKHGNLKQQKKLQRRITPFMLRRLKSEVATELPIKTEIIHHVQLEGEQRDLYESIRLSMHDKIKTAIREKGLARSQIIILDALLKMRQACCDPRLVKLKSNRKTDTSHKLNFLITMLDELLQEGRKVLLFSSFTSMLEIIEEQLIQRSIKYIKLTGQTQNRASLIQSFQEGDIPVFLLSLKAGGTGLNLTAADTVIHYDPWWNPAAEQQATDRAHRIGQQKPVFVYKLIAANTIEEKILKLQQKKQALINQLYDAQEGKSFSLSEADLEELFQS